MSVKARLLKSNEFTLWDQYVDRHPAGTIFHKTGWLKLVGYDLQVITVWIDEKIIAGVALVSTVKTKIKGYHIPPYTQYFSPLYGHPESKKNSITEEHECIQILLEKIKSAKHIDFRLPGGHQSILPYHWKGYESVVNITYVINGTLEAYLSGLNKNKLRELKKLQGLVETGELQVESNISETDLAHLLKQTSERKGFNARTDLAIKLVMQSDASFAKKMVIRSREHGIMSFGFFPYDNKAVYNLINASVRVNDPVLKTVNLLLLYQAIEFALNSGRKFDFEGSMLPGVESFCRLMGGKQVPVYRVQKSGSLIYSVLRAAKQIKNDRKKA